MQKKLGVALGAGGFRGPAHIGVLEILEKHQVEINYIAGTSIGALMGAHYALYQDIKKMRTDIADAITNKYQFFGDLGATGGFISGKRIETFLRKIYQGATFSDCKIPLKIISCDLITGKKVVFDEGDLATAVRASISIPMIFKPHAHQEQLLIDGAILDPVPCDILPTMGAEVILAVNLYNNYTYHTKKMSMAQAAIRATELTISELAKISMAKADLIVTPDTSEFYELSQWQKFFDLEITNTFVQTGKEAMENNIKKLKQLL